MIGLGSLLKICCLRSALGSHSRVPALRVFILAVSFFVVISCASVGGADGMPSWWGRPLDEDNSYSVFLTEKCSGDDFRSLEPDELKKLRESVVVAARNRTSSFFGATSLPSDLFSVVRESSALSDGANAYAAEVSVPYRDIYRYNPDVGKRVAAGEEEAAAHYSKSVEHYEKYRDAKAVEEMVRAAEAAFKHKVVTGKYAYAKLIRIAANMLGKIEMTSGSPNDLMEREIKVRRASNMIWEGVDGAVVRMSVRDADASTSYYVDYVTDAKGRAFTKRTYYMLPKDCQLDYALKLDITSEQRSLAEADEGFFAFFRILDGKRFSDAFAQPDRSEKYAVLSFMQDGNDVLSVSEDMQDVIVRNNGTYGNVIFENLSSESNIDEVVARVGSDPELSKCRMLLISIMQTDSERNISGIGCVLHSYFDLHIYDAERKAVVKSLYDLENLGIGEDREQARESLEKNQISMLSKYMMEFFGRLLGTGG